MKELFEAQEAQAARKSRAELMKAIDADYYGYLDDDDNLLVPQGEIKSFGDKLGNINFFF